MSEHKILIKVLGTRGSMSVSKKECEIFGGDTSCFQIICDKDDLILDGGSGILNAMPIGDTTNIFLSHLHLDHVMGLSVYPGLAIADHTTNIYIPSYSDKSGKDDMRTLFNPPFWPLGLEDYPGNISLHWEHDTMELGPYRISTADGHHPGGCKIITVFIDDKKIVYATDYEHDDKGDKSLCEIAADADILFYDGAYTQDEYRLYKGYGHSTPQEGIRIAKEASAKKLVITHHMIDHYDDMLIRMEKEARAEFDGIYFAREGDILEL